MQGSDFGFDERQALLIFSFRAKSCGLASGSSHKIRLSVASFDS
jgi:hypothetical protein